MTQGVCGTLKSRSIIMFIDVSSKHQHCCFVFLEHGITPAVIELCREFNRAASQDVSFSLQQRQHSTRTNNINCRSARVSHNSHNFTLTNDTMSLRSVCLSNQKLMFTNFGQIYFEIMFLLVKSITCSCTCKYVSFTNTDHRRIT